MSASDFFVYFRRRSLPYRESGSFPAGLRRFDPTCIRRFFLAFILSCGLSGCTAVVMGMGSDGVDVELVRTGMSRAEIDEVLGSPLFAKGSRSTRYIATYAVDQGRPPSAKRAAMGAWIDLMTLGMVAPMMERGQPMHERPRLVVVYDGDDRAIGLFDMDVEIPADGRSTERPSALIRKVWGEEGEP
jgi:hypothetical protein